LVAVCFDDDKHECAVILCYALLFEIS